MFRMIHIVQLERKLLACFELSVQLVMLVYRLHGEDWSVESQPFFGRRTNRLWCAP